MIVPATLITDLPTNVSSRNGPNWRVGGEYLQSLPVGSATDYLASRGAAGGATTERYFKQRNHAR